MYYVEKISVNLKAITMNNIYDIVNNIVDNIKKDIDDTI